MVAKILFIVLKFAIKALVAIVFLAAAAISFVVAIIVGLPFLATKKVKHQPALIKA
jgi:hypothetical protein